MSAENVQSVRAAYEALGAGDAPAFFEALAPDRVAAEEFIDGGDTVVVIGRYEVRTSGAGELPTWFVHVFDLAGGRIARFLDDTDTAVKLNALVAGRT